MITVSELREACERIEREFGVRYQSLYSNKK